MNAMSRKSGSSGSTIQYTGTITAETLVKMRHIEGGWKKGTRPTWITSGSTANARKSTGNGVTNMKNTRSTSITRQCLLCTVGGDSVSAVGFFGL